MDPRHRVAIRRTPSVDATTRPSAHYGVAHLDAVSAHRRTFLLTDH